VRTPEENQRRALAVIAFNALSGIPGMRPSPELLKRVMAPSDEDYEEDPVGTSQRWRQFCEDSYRTFRLKGVKRG
jgi:hypothetical protein